MVKKWRRQEGFSTIEILIASSILVIVFSAVIMLVLGGQKISVDTQLAHEAELLNTKLIEEARAATLNNFLSDVTIDPPIQESGTTYFKQRHQRYISECVKEVIARIDYTIEGRAQYVTKSTQVTSPATALAMGTECNTGFPPGGDSWNNCYLFGSARLSGPDQDAYDLDVTRINGQKYVFIVTHPKNTQQAPEDFWVYNTEN